MSSVVFIGSPDHFPNKNSSELFLVAPQDLFFRVWASFVPPLTKKYRKVYVDFLGPLLGLVLLASLLTYGYSFKKYKMGMSPVEVVLAFGTFMPAFCFVLAKLGKSTVCFSETVSLVGYSFFGHFLTLLISYIFYHETNNIFFFISMIFWGGSSTFRLILVFLNTIKVPGVRFLVGLSIALVNMLFLIFLHFGFMHRTFT